jgi:hypothetical protein
MNEMRMIACIALLINGLVSVSSANDVDSTGIQIDTSFWSAKSTLGLFFSQHTYSDYYKGGGTNSIALGSTFDYEANYRRGKRTWENGFKLRYGVIKASDLPLQKNDDHIEIVSKYGYKFSPHLKFTGLLNMTSRLHDVYTISKNGERGKRIGNFLAPVYVNLGSGIDYFTKDKVLSIYYSPVNSKLTYVADPTLIGQYLPKAKEGHNAQYELGSLLRFEAKKEIMTNIFLHTIGTFFMNHLNDFGAVDVNIENKINFKVNKLFSVNLLTQLIYDEDILFDIADLGGAGEDVSTRKGPRTQFREVLNIGLSHSF